MSQCARILDVLQDGRWHSVLEIHQRAGYSRLNSRVSDLRKQGYTILCDTQGEGRATERYRYRLVVPLGGVSCVSPDRQPEESEAGRSPAERPTVASSGPEPQPGRAAQQLTFEEVAA